MSLPSFDVLDTFSEICDCIIEIHQSRMDKSSIEIIDPIIWFERNGFLKLC